MRRPQPSRFTKALLETADDMRRLGILGPAAHESIAQRRAEGEQYTRYELEKLLAGITPENLPDEGFDDAPVGKEAL